MKNIQKAPVSQKESPIENIGAVFIILLTFLFSLKCFLTAMTGVFSFDGGIMAQAAQNMAKSFRYATSYFTGENDFCNALTVGLPVVAPAALLFKIFGESFTAGLTVNAAYMVLLFLSVAYFFKNCLKLGNFYVLLVLLLLAGTKDIFILGFGLYGEIAMCFFIMAGFIFFHKYFEDRNIKNLFWTGVFTGLAYITKQVTLIVVPVMLFVIMWDYFVYGKNQKQKIKLSDYTGFIYGFIIPSVVVEFYKIIMLGAGGFINWWLRQLVGIKIQSGAVKVSGMAETYGILLKYNKHLDLLAEQTGLNRLLVVILLYMMAYVFLALLYYGFKYLKNTKKQKTESVIYSNAMMMIIAFAMIYFIWWIFITPTGRAWYRRILTGVIFYEAALVYAVYLASVLIKKYSAKFTTQGKRIVTACAYLLFAGIIFVSVWRIADIKNHEFSIYDTAEKTGILDAGRFIKQLPQGADFYGFNWWQAPNISFTSGKIFKNIIKDPEMATLGDKQEKYFVVDRWAMTNESVCYVKLAGDYENELVFSNKEAFIYKLNKRIKVTHPEECN